MNNNWPGTLTGIYWHANPNQLWKSWKSNDLVIATLGLSYLYT